MHVTVTHGNPEQIACDLLILNMFEGDDPPNSLHAVDKALGGWISQLLAEENFTGKTDSTLDFLTFGKIPARRVLIVGLGKPKDFSAEAIRIVSATAIHCAKKFKARRVATLPHGIEVNNIAAPICAQAITEGSILGDYQFIKYKSADEDSPRVDVDELTIITQNEDQTADVQTGITTGTIIASAVNMARDLTMEPPEVVKPDYLAKFALKMGEEYGLQVEVWDDTRLVAERMQCLLMVGRGSANPPRFIQLTYHPENKAKKHLCLVGKGLCYDSGGLSLKPSSAMQNMKTDMAGAAAVLAVMRVIAQLKPNCSVSGYIPACENMTGPAAYKVDDVLRARNGKTIEIDNTDAEGRLVLADALSLAAEKDFDEVIDFATLTGACVIALAHIWSGIMGNNQPLIDRLLKAGNETGERMWMLPFDKEVRKMLDSDIADIKNSAGREGSAIQGGIFLQEFIGEIPWAHIDIAGTSFLDKANGYLPKGATGVPTRSIIAYLLEQ